MDYGLSFQHTTFFCLSYLIYLYPELAAFYPRLTVEYIQFNIYFRRHSISVQKFPTKLLLCILKVMCCIMNLPSVQLSQNHFRTIIQTMRKLQHLDILWRSKDNIKFLLQIVGCPFYGHSVKRLTIRVLEVEDLSFCDAMCCLLDEWVASRLTPRNIKISAMTGNIRTASVFRKWKC